MAISNATRLSDFGSGIGTAGAVLKVDNTTQRVGIGTTDPRGMLQVGTAITMNGNTGIATFTTVYATTIGDSNTTLAGDGSELTGISAGSFASNDTGINTTTSVGVGTTNATGAADVQNSAILNVGVVTAVTTFSNIVGTAGTFTSILATGLSGTPDITINNLTGVAATFSGVLTYEDVTNVDSIGIVTARGGFEIGAAGVGGTITSVGDAEFTGVCTATSFYGDGSTLTNAGITAGKSVGLAAFLGC